MMHGQPNIKSGRLDSAGSRYDPVADSRYLLDPINGTRLPDDSENYELLQDADPVS